MINKGAFARRLKKLLEYHEISASALADKIGVQRSSISHLLSGRNNPSLDFVMKIQEHFPEISFEWLIKGKGKLGAVSETSIPPTLFDQDIASPKTVVADKKTIEKQNIPNIVSNNLDKAVSKIVFFYKDGSFEIYQE